MLFWVRAHMSVSEIALAVPRPECGEAREGAADGGHVLRANGVTKTFARGMWPRRHVLHVLRGASLELGRGEIVGLVGENGSGKSTLLKILSGALPREGGTIERRGRIGYCPQDPILYERLTCDEHFELFGRAYGMDRPRVEEARRAIYDILGFGGWAAARVAELSGGTRSKLNLGLALLPDPGILLLDEPYAGFDWETYQRFWYLAAERRDAGRAVLIISHFVTDAERFDRIYEMREGRAVAR
ncbi:MAG TPA: ABC transporter ATP-binding protein [Actinomycetota bacterium]|nr:ABC transporter ATP-binding protein [Actinomycetota bacterium]